MPSGSGVRAQAVGADGSMVDDFVINRHGRVVAVRNAPSPAATSSLAIADHIWDAMARRPERVDAPIAPAVGPVCDGSVGRAIGRRVCRDERPTMIVTTPARPARSLATRIAGQHPPLMAPTRCHAAATTSPASRSSRPSANG